MNCQLGWHGRRRAPVALILVVSLSHILGAATGKAQRMHECFDAGWRFHLGDVEGGEAPSLDDASWRVLDLPHDWSIEHPFSPDHASGTGYLPGGIGWYRKTFDVPADLGDDELSILFDGVYRNSDVWINGRHLGHRPNGYASFAYRLTPHVRVGQSNTLAVRVARENVADSRWYTGTGIYRHTWLTRTRPIHIGQWGVFVATPRVRDDMADVTVTVDVVNRSDVRETVNVETEILSPEGAVVASASARLELAERGKATAALWHVVSHPRRWSPDSPVLYRQSTRVTNDGGVLDVQDTRLGIRSFRFDPTDGFFLNEKPTILRGLCMHHDAGVVGSAVPEPVLAHRLRQIKAIGGNAVRCSHNPMAPEFYALCDELGLLVMDEAFDEWEGGKRKWVKGRNVGRSERFGYAEAFETWGVRDCEDMVRRDRNHPSIILWSIGNEIDYPGDPYVHPDFFDPGAPPPDPDSPRMNRLAVIAPQLIAAVKRQDPTRPVTMALSNLPAANALGLAAMVDVAGYNYQEQYYEQDHRDFPGRIILGSENGRGPRTWRAVRDNEYISGQFLWVGFDFLGEAGPWPNHASRAGVFDTRAFWKPMAWQQRALWSEEPMVHALIVSGEPSRRRGMPRPSAYPRRWKGEMGESIRVGVFTTCAEVELYLNERRVGGGEPNPFGQFVTTLPFEPGELSVVGMRDGEAVARDHLRTAGPAQRLECVRIDYTDPVAQLAVLAVDGDQNLVTDATLSVTALVTGAGRLIGIDNGDTNDPTPLSSPTRSMIDGRLLVLVHTGDPAGPIRLTVTAPGVDPAEWVFPEGGPGRQTNSDHSP